MDFLITSTLAATEATAEAAVEATRSASGLTGVLGTLGINGKLFLAQLVNFGLLVFVLWRLLYKPLVSFMEARSKRIAEGLTNAARYDEKLKALEAERRAVLERAEGDGRQALAAAVAEAEQVKAAARVEAEQAAAELKARAAREIEQEKRQMLNEVRAEAADLVVLAAEKVIHERVDEAKDRHLVEQALNEAVSSRVIKP